MLPPSWLNIPRVKKIFFFLFFFFLLRIVAFFVGCNHRCHVIGGEVGSVDDDVVIVNIVIVVVVVKLIAVFDHRRHGVHIIFQHVTAHF